MPYVIYILDFETQSFKFMEWQVPNMVKNHRTCYNNHYTLSHCSHRITCDAPPSRSNSYSYISIVCEILHVDSSVRIPFPNEVKLSVKTNMWLQAWVSRKVMSAKTRNCHVSNSVNQIECMLIRQWLR